MRENSRREGELSTVLKIDKSCSLKCVHEKLT